MPRPRPDTSVVKRCYTCKETKPRGEFYPNPKAFDGLAGSCKACSIKSANAWRKKDPTRHAKNAREWAKRNRRSVRNTFLKRLYGITIEQYDAMLAAQRGGCAICGTTEPGGTARFFHVDHCHDTEAVRGLLCGKCNTGIGQLDHDINRLQSAINYLTKYSPSISQT